MLSKNRSFGAYHLHFRQNDWVELGKLYAQAKTDRDWPTLLQSPAAIQQFSQTWDTITWLGDGHVEICMAEDDYPIGYCTLEKVDPLLCPNHAITFEGGTYLLEVARGTGVNAKLKERHLELAKTNYAADWLIYAVADNNQRAIAAFHKLTWQGQRISHTDVNHPWYPYLKRKMWLYSTAITLFAFPLK